MKSTRTFKSPAVLFATLLLSSVAFATSHEVDEHESHHPEASTPTDAAQASAPEARMQALRERMREMQETRDPKARAQMMEEQMADMEAMMEQMPAMCPMMSGSGKGGMGGMGGMGMMGGMGPGMMQGQQGDAGPGMMEKRMDMMEKRMDMMQMMMQRQMGQPADKGASPNR